MVKTSAGRADSSRGVEDKYFFTVDESDEQAREDGKCHPLLDFASGMNVRVGLELRYRLGTVGVERAREFLSNGRGGRVLDR